MAKSLSPIKIPSAKAEDQPATRKMLRLVRDELKSEIHAVGRKMESQIDGLRSDMKISLTRMEILLEDQHANNRIVLEGHQLLWQRQDRIERLVIKN